MSRIISLTGLSQGRLIVVRVRSRNSNGWSLLSQENISGAVIEVVPHKMTSVYFDVPNSTDTKIILQWDATTGVSTGGSPIIGYTV